MLTRNDDIDSLTLAPNDDDCTLALAAHDDDCTMKTAANDDEYSVCRMARRKRRSLGARSLQCACSVLAVCCPSAVGQSASGSAGSSSREPFKRQLETCLTTDCNDTPLPPPPCHYFAISKRTEHAIKHGMTALYQCT